MGLVDGLKGSVVALDTAPLIYYIEEHPLYIETVEPIFDAIDHGEITVVTSMVTLLEVLVKPFRIQDKQLAERYRDLLLNMKGLSMFPLSQEIAEKAAAIRAIHNKVRTPDAIQLATAITAKASFFITNDANLPTLPELHNLVLSHPGV